MLFGKLETEFADHGRLMATGSLLNTMLPELCLIAQHFDETYLPTSLRSRKAAFSSAENMKRHSRCRAA